MRICDRPREALPPEQRRFKRAHGLQLPLHPLQVLGWIALGGISVGALTVLTPLLRPNLRVPFLALVATLLLFHLGSHLIALLVDPAEAQVRLHRGLSEKPEFDRAKHRQLIENGRCHLCNIDASGSRTKHCWDCNKCVVGFDHHCKWLNNCVGERNYLAFICCVVSAIAATLVIITTIGLVLVELAEVGALCADCIPPMDNSSQPLIAQLPGTSSFVVISIIGVLSAIAAILLIHLCLFHGYIACLGLTTYEYMRKRRDKARAKPDTTNQSLSQKVQPVSYHFCESVSSETQLDSRSVYFCSTHAQSPATIAERKSERERKKFHLYFSYETRSNETTSIELSSADSSDGLTSLASLASLTNSELKASTPSPVSCCFSIMGPTDKKQTKKQSNESLDQEERRSCTTIKRIQSFLRTKLRKSVHRQRALNIDAGSVRKNKITPFTSSESLDKEETVKSICHAVKDGPLQVRPPPKLPPLVLNARHRSKQVGNVHSPTASVMLKRNQQHMRVRKSLVRKRPRFTIDNLAQTAQLSPIPESDQSKPASPFAPPQHFTFSPVHSK